MTRQSINDAKHWRDRAAEMRVLSDIMKDERSQRILLKLRMITTDSLTAPKIALRVMS